MDNPTKKANSFFLTDHQDLQFIFAKIRKLNEINEKILAILDPAIKKYCQVANVAGNKLVLLTANSSIATQVRFQAPDILSKLQKIAALSHIKEIQTKVGMPQRQELRNLPKDKELRKVAQLSQETADLILEFAQSLDDPKLREVMEKIAKNREKG